MTCSVRLRQLLTRCHTHWVRETQDDETVGVDNEDKNTRLYRQVEGDVTDIKPLVLPSTPSPPHVGGKFTGLSPHVVDTSAWWPFLKQCVGMTSPTRHSRSHLTTARVESYHVDFLSTWRWWDPFSLQVLPKRSFHSKLNSWTKFLSRNLNLS